MVTVFIIFLNLLGLIIVKLDELHYRERFSTFVYWAWLVVPTWGRFFPVFFFKIYFKNHRRAIGESMRLLVKSKPDFVGMLALLLLQKRCWFCYRGLCKN